MAEFFRDYQAEPCQGDGQGGFVGGRLPWWQNEDGVAFARALGLGKDAIAEGARQARAQRWISKAAEDALAAHGRARGWERVSGETLDQYRARLRAWWSLAQWQGTKKGIVDAFALLGMTNVVVREALEYTTTATWGRYPSVDQQRDFCIVVRQPHPFGGDFSFRYDDGTLWDGSKTWGVTGDPSLFRAIRTIARRMRPAHSKCREIILVLAGDITDGTNTAADGDPATPAARVAYLLP